MGKSTRKTELFVGIFVLILGIGLTVGAFIFKNERERKINSWPHTQAVVVDYEADWDDDDDDYMYREIVSYTVDGKNYRKKSDSSSNIRPSLGVTREIAYNPDKPSECVFVESLTPIFIIMLIVGVGFTAASVMLFVQVAKKNRQ